VTSIPLPPLLGDLKERAFGEFHRQLEAEGYEEIRAAHGCVFRFVDDKGCRLTDLAERARLTKQAIGEVVDDLEALGYVERVSDPEDGRAKIIRLTDRGREAQEAAARIFADIERHWGEQVGHERVAELRATLEALAIAELTAEPVG
jgi:DNA-binding MarR family transcriptional regulator